MARRSGRHRPHGALRHAWPWRSFGVARAVNMERMVYSGVVLLVCVTAALAQDQMSQSRRECPDVEHVCGSLMKVQDQRANEEGTYCMCDACQQLTWDEADPRAFTWYHHEKRHWLVQYRFCEPVLPVQVCRHGLEVGAVIRTDARGWNPRLRKLDCRCPDTPYYLQGWHLVDNAYWDYHYTCDQTSCVSEEENSVDDKPCVKRYMDATGVKTVGYRFLCSCPKGYSCPIHFEDEEGLEIEDTDQNGPFIRGYCRIASSKQPKPVTKA